MRNVNLCFNGTRDAGTRGQMGAAHLLPSKSGGKGGKGTLLILSTDLIFFTFSSYIRSAIRLDDLPRNATMVGSIYLWKVTLQFNF